MNRGFFMLGSSMLTQSRTLNTISNNIANIKTAGYKRDTMLSKTFGEMVMNRIDGGRTELGDVSHMRTADISAKIHSQGQLESSDRNMDFALFGAGFFKVKNAETDPVYTRNGSFDLDNEGFLILEGVGRVQGEDGDIYLGTDKFTTDGAGTILSAEREVLGKIGVYNFEDYNTLLTVDDGMYRGEADGTLVESPDLRTNYLEMSNVDLAREMASTIETQRILQNVSQAFKMYDATLQSATTQIGRIG